MNKVGVYKVNIQPIPLARPRWSPRGHVMYDSQVHDKISFALYVQQQHTKQLKDYKFQGPLKLEAYFFMNIPKSRIKQHLEHKPHNIRPDIDNLEKFLLDSCGEIFYDDCQFSEIHCYKQYSPTHKGYTEFRITELS